MLIRALVAPLLAAVLGLLVSGTAAPADAQDKRVNLYSWSGYFSAGVLEDFTRATGIKTDLQTYDTRAEADAKLKAGGTGRDIVLLSAEPFLDSGIRAGLYQPLDAMKVPALSGQDPAVMKLLQSADFPAGSAAVYLWGTMGLAYNVEQLKKRLPDVPADSYALLFDPRYAKKLAGCGIGLIDDPLVVLPMALRYLGIDPNKAAQADWERAAALVGKIRPHVKTIDSTTLVGDLVEKKLCLATEWNGDAIQAANRAKSAQPPVTIDYFVPKEGGLAFVDAIAIPKDAPHPATAYAFLNYLFQPKVIARSAGELGYPSAMTASFPFLYPVLAGDPRFLPPDAVKARLTLVKPLAPELQGIVDQLWAQVKAGQPAPQ
jgi:putrescine transport system substrate-binding protein